MTIRDFVSFAALTVASVMLPACDSGYQDMMAPAPADSSAAGASSDGQDATGGKAGGTDKATGGKEASQSDDDDATAADDDDDSSLSNSDDDDDSVAADDDDDSVSDPCDMAGEECFSCAAGHVCQFACVDGKLRCEGKAEPSGTSGASSGDDDDDAAAGDDDDDDSSTGTGGSTSTGGACSTGGSSEATGGSGEQECVPGTTEACGCSGNRQGIAHCLSDGRLDLCECSQGTGGASGDDDDDDETGGTSTGGSSCTGGSATGGTGGSATGGTSSTGGSSSVAKRVTYTAIFSTDADHSWPMPFFVYAEDGADAKNDASCVGNATEQSCTFTVMDDRFTDFWIATGRSGGGSYLPGKQGDTGYCTAYSVGFLINREGVEIPFSMVPNPNGDGCRFRVETHGAVRTGDDPDGDRATTDDCDVYNPTFRPKKTPEDTEYVDDYSNTCEGVALPGLFRFEIPDTFSNDAQLLVVDPYLPIACVHATVRDREIAADVNGTVCEVWLDAATEPHFNILLDGEWATYFPAEGSGCQGSFPVYVLRDGQPYAQYWSEASGFDHWLETVHEQGTCHLVLPGVG
jgi:hypothetical protein